MADVTSQTVLSVLQGAWPTIFSEQPTTRELHTATMVARHESGYGTGWKGEMVGSNNWGAIQASTPPCTPGVSAPNVDTHPNADGTSTPYTSCFKVYATPEAGAADLLHVLFVVNKRQSVRNAANTGSIYAVAKAMHDTGYYEGFGSTVEQRVQGYADALWANYQAFLKISGAAAVMSPTGDPSIISPVTPDTPVQKGSAANTSSNAGPVPAAGSPIGKWLAMIAAAVAAWWIGKTLLK